MNLEEFPEDVKQDIEDQSLEILEQIAPLIVVIGGWGVRAHLGESHHRYTLDVDGVTDEGTLTELRKFFRKNDFTEASADWGVKFFKKYSPRVDVPDSNRKAVDSIEIRLEISLPRIKEGGTHHYFEFSMANFVEKDIPYHGKDKSVPVRVPPIEDLAAVKLGLPVDYKHNHDAAMLLRKCDVEKVIASIKSNDDWASLVLRRMPKLKGRISQRDSIENILAVNAGLDIRRHLKTLDIIEKALR